MGTTPYYHLVKHTKNTQHGTEIDLGGQSLPSLMPSLQQCQPSPKQAGRFDIIMNHVVIEALVRRFKPLFRRKQPHYYKVEIELYQAHNNTINS